MSELVSTDIVSDDSPTHSRSASWLVDALEEAEPLSAVEQFARKSAELEVARQRRYAALLPAAPPRPGQQYAFEVDLDRCSGCKGCVTACHAQNGLDEEETWRDVGLLIGGTRALPVIQHVTTACHHCLEPACLQGCPVNAYEKDPLTGIVKHLDDQCFGCQYCTLACPYEVPKYHRGKGIVRKCDMCSQRLSAGEPPACVAACPHSAIAIRVVDVERVIEDAEVVPFLPCTPDPQITLPTTHYKTQRVLPRNLLPADYFQVTPQHAHWPLVVMLVLTQLSVGAFIWSAVLDWPAGSDLADRIHPKYAGMAAAFGLLAISASVLHLGRPQYAYRAVLGLRHSWLSREIVAFGMFAVLALLDAALRLAGARLGVAGSAWMGALDWSVAAVGALAVAASAMIYISTGRECWSPARVAIRFALCGLLLGAALFWLSLLMLELPHDAQRAVAARQMGPVVCAVLMGLSVVKLSWEGGIFRHLWSRRTTILKRSALLMTRDLSGLIVARFATGILGGIVLPALLWKMLSADSSSISSAAVVVLAGMSFLACLVGELLERTLFFRACVFPKMPGGLR